jgi:uncharacterized membrane protein YbhN (UPF0104 family)
VTDSPSPTERPRLQAIPLGTGGTGGLPEALAPRRLARRFVQVVGLLAVVVLIAFLAPGLGEVRRRLDDLALGWVAVAVVLEVLSCGSYVLMFRAIFCSRMSWRTSAEIGLSELAVGSLVPASGAAGLAFGAWILHRGGMPADRIARRSVAFFLIKSSVNFVAVAVLGAVMAIGLVGPHQPLWLTALPAALAAAVIVLVVALPAIGRGPDAAPDASKARRGLVATRRAVIDGTAEAVAILRSAQLLVIVGAIGYWAFDNAVLWATFHAVGAQVPVSIVLMGYLIGQLGGLLPIPGGIGGIDGGLLGTLVVYGAPAAETAAAVLAYRVILFWLPLLLGAPAFLSLRRALDEFVRPDLCEPMGVAPL